MTARPNLTKCETKPEIDPYHRDTMGETLTVLTIDPRDGEYSLTQEYDDNATSALAWHGVIIEQTLGNSCRPDEDEARSYLSSPEAVDLVQRILDGHKIEWDGSNHVGRTTDDADAALDELINKLQNLPASEWSIWSVDDWCESVQIIADMTDEQLAQIADDCQTAADDEHVILHGDLLDYLTGRRSEAVAEIE